MTIDSIKENLPRFIKWGGEKSQVMSGFIPVILKYYIFISNYVNSVMLYMPAGSFVLCFCYVTLYCDSAPKSD